MNILGFKRIFLLFLLFCMFSEESEGQQITKLSASFIDPPQSPLVIYGIPFSSSVIYQNNFIYAPAEDFLTMTGTKFYLQNLPSQLVINGQSAPLSLLATGPDRYTGKNTYYLNVTETLNYLGIYYRISTENNSVRITVEDVPQTVSSLKSTVSGHVVYQYFERGTVRIIETYVNSARMPQTREFSSTNLPSDGYYNFSDIPPGEYIIEATCFYSVTGPVVYDCVSKQAYRCVTTYIPTWQKRLILKGGETLTVDFLPEQAVVRSEEKLIYLGIMAPGTN
ncbi:MAG: hypothetical protein ABRQ37_12065 [Candidatus Eremiobacterota bacterium]